MGGREKGFTLIEVLAALVLMGLVVSIAAQTLTLQTRIFARGNSQIETQQSARAAAGLLDREIRQAKTVALTGPGILKVTRSNNQSVYFYVADKDYNGVKDLYQETDGVPNPVASYVEQVDFADMGAGRWDVVITARQNGVENQWKLTIKRRAD